MTPGRDRLIGTVWYALTVVLIVAGGVWWVRSAPDTGVDPRLAGWRETVEEVLPDRADQVEARTVALRMGAGAEQQADVSAGAYVLDVICAGRGRAQVRLSAIGDDSDRSVPCADRPEAVSFTISVEQAFIMEVDFTASADADTGNADTGSADTGDAETGGTETGGTETGGTAMFRWRLTRLPD